MNKNTQYSFFEEDNNLLIAGVDEAGRGCLAGPVVAAAVILPIKYDLPLLGDSKKFTAKQREIIAQKIKEQAIAIGYGIVWQNTIDEINILQASLLAMKKAVFSLKIQPKNVLLDGNMLIKDFPYKQKAIIKGDSLEPCISAASIIAKTYRDSLMCFFDKKYPAYGLAKHKGYGTAAHYEALAKFGASKLHRMTFRGVAQPKEKEEKEEKPCCPLIY